MKNKFLFEKYKLKKNSRNTAIITACMQLTFLYFFTLIGRFESSSTDNILNNYPGLLSLATTGTTCILVIYGAIIINRLLVTNYIGDSRLRLYLYPCGRSDLYYTKNKVFGISFGLAQLVGFLAANLIYLLVESFFPILNSSFSVSGFVGYFVGCPIIAVSLTIAMVSFSSIIGIRLASSIATIITALILITTLGNMLALLLAEHIIITTAVTIVISLFVYGAIKVCGTKIEKEEVL